jgi:hypothetical protein
MTSLGFKPSGLVAATAFLAVALAAAPLSLDSRGWVGQAMAAGNGHGNGGGNGHGNGGGDGNSGNGNGNGGDHSSAGGSGNVGDQGDRGVDVGQNASGSSGDPAAGASGLGSLNAAHASPQALANASSKSQVGRIESYKEALDKYRSDLVNGTGDLSTDITAVAGALAAASNKTLTTNALNDLNGLLGESTVVDPNWDSATAPSIVDQANAF